MTIRYLERDVQYLMDKHGVAWWRCDETSGNTIVDSKGSFNGTATNVARVTGVNGNALSFNGTSSRISFTNKIIPFGRKSIRFKIKRDGKPSNPELIMSNSFSSGSGGGIQIVINTNGGLDLLLRGSSSNVLEISDTTDICDNKWHDVLFIYDGNTIFYYVDDFTNIVNQGTRVGNEGNSNTTNLEIGRRASSNDLYFNGQLDEIEIYNEVINPNLNKSLISSDDGEHYSYDNSTGIWTPRGINPTQEDYENYGMYDEDLQALTKADLLTLPNLTSGKPKVRTFKYS